MHIDEGDDTTIGIGAGDDGEYGEQQHVLKLVALALGTAWIGDIFQQVQQRCERGHGNLRLGCRVTNHRLFDSRIRFLPDGLILARRCCISDSHQPVMSVEQP